MHLKDVAEDDMQISVEGNSIRDDAMEFVAEVGLAIHFSLISYRAMSLSSQGPGRFLEDD